MSMTWATIKDMYLEATGNNPKAEQEWSVHQTEGYRRVAGELDIPELRQPEASFVIAADGSGGWLDYFELAGECDVYAIESLHNSTDGLLMLPEPGGMSGRSRHLEPTDDDTTRPRPPAGTPQWWVREGSRIYVRDRPQRSTRIEIRFHIQVPQITAADLDDHPLTPQQYDRALVLAAAESFYEMHPKENRPVGDQEGSPLASQFFSGAAAGAMARKSPRSIEDRTSTSAMRLAGFSVTPRSRR